jgi:hypothetical protein
MKINEKNNKYEKDNIRIIFTSKGRNFPEKAWDSEYYDELLCSQFVLCPNGDFVWTYRFFEAIMCGAIPIIEDRCDIYEGFYFYDMKDPVNKLKYSKKNALENLEILKEKYSFFTNESIGSFIKS